MDKKKSVNTVDGCPFCYSRIRSKVVKELRHVAAVYDTTPVTEGHMLIIPKRHCPDFFAMTREEQMETIVLLEELKEKLLGSDPGITGFNIGMNAGESAGQTIFHSHIHLIPRRDGDTPNPRGGVRGVIPNKMDY